MNSIFIFFLFSTKVNETQIHPKSELLSWIFQNVTNWTVACCTNELNGKGRLLVLSACAWACRYMAMASHWIKSNLSLSHTVFSWILRWACDGTDDIQHDICYHSIYLFVTNFVVSPKGSSYFFIFFRFQLSTNWEQIQKKEKSKLILVVSPKVACLSSLVQSNKIFSRERSS